LSGGVAPTIIKCYEEKKEEVKELKEEENLHENAPVIKTLAQYEQEQAEKLETIRKEALVKVE